MVWVSAKTRVSVSVRVGISVRLRLRIRVCVKIRIYLEWSGREVSPLPLRLGFRDWGLGFRD